MKIYSIFLFFVYFFVFQFFSCSNEKKNNQLISTEVVNNPNTAMNENADMSKLPKFEFKTINYDFGSIVQGENVSCIFNFKNVGGSDLVITSASGSCGCTVPKVSKDPVPSGKNGEIEVIFDSSGKTGKQKKTITVLANTQPNKTELTITCEVIVP